MASSNDSAIREFCNITASTPEQALFFLESSGWQVPTAIQNYYDAYGAGLQREDEGEEEEAASTYFNASPVPDPALASAPAPVPVGGPIQGTGRFVSSSSKDKKSTTNSRGGGIRTLSDFNRRSDSDSDDDTQEYYTGGEKSGMMVQDPQKGNRVDAIFEQARRMGAQEGPSEPQTHSGKNTFTGIGRTLAGEPVYPGTAPRQPSHQPDPIVRNITFWRNGFTVDDGPLRRIDDPANAQFLTSISKSECPKELEPAERGTPVHVNLVRRDEDWKPPPEPKHVPFQGTSRTIGSSSSTSSNATISVNNTDMGSSQGLIVDEASPVTSIQIRLSDGTRMIARFNHYHTIADIRRFIDAARPGTSRIYQLQTMGFPPRVLSDVTQTIEVAGLANAVIIQKT